MAGRGEQHVLGDRVAALGEHDGSGRLAAGLDGGLVEAVGGGDVEAEGLERGQVGLDGAGAEVGAAPGIARGTRKRQLVEQRPEERGGGAGAAGGVDVDAREVEARRGATSRSLLSGSRRTRTPIEVSAWMIRVTSSMSNTAAWLSCVLLIKKDHQPAAKSSRQSLQRMQVPGGGWVIAGHGFWSVPASRKRYALAVLRT